MSDTEQIPYLCGGTFFCLLTEARKRGAHVSNTGMLEALLRFVDPTFRRPASVNTRAFDTEVSAYRSCRHTSGTYFPFGHPKKCEAFDQRIRENYAGALAEANSFVIKFIDPNPATVKWLIAALLELTEQDGPRGGLYALPSGKAVSAGALLSQPVHCLSALLLGLWHFIVMHRPENEAGRATYEAWYVPPREKGEHWTFRSDLGRTRRSRIVYELTGTAEDLPAAASTEPEAAAETEAVEPVPVPAEDARDETVKTLPQYGIQMINNGSGPQIGVITGDATFHF